MLTEHLLEVGVRRQLAALGLGKAPLRLLVALSGGCDSVVLLYLVRFRLPSLTLEVEAAHLDHAMRGASAGDALWVRGLCAAWGIPVVIDRLARPPASEGEARTARYEFLRSVGESRGTELIATAHHADDQAETVLFRVLRGTGLKGLAGISPRAGGILRPLLPLWRREIEAYAREKGLAWRTDVTNASLDPVRNRIRHEVLPLLEERVSPSARRSLVSLAALASEAEEALERIAKRAEADLVRWEDGTPSLARDLLRSYDSAVASRVLRNVLRHFGVVPGRTGTRRALQFITDAHSGRQMPLPGRLLIEVEFDRARIRRVVEPGEERGAVIQAPDPEDERGVRIGGLDYVVRYGPASERRIASARADLWTYLGNPALLAFPLRIRAWRDGDHARTRRGRRSLKRIFLEERVPRERRRRLPLLVDAAGEVVWVAGIRAFDPHDAPAEGQSFYLQVLHD